VLGVIAAMIYSRTNQYLFYELSLMFILLNIFNLIPLTPLDGGQIIETIFPRQSFWIQAIFIVLSSMSIVFMVIAYETNILVVVFALLIFKLFRLIKRRREEDGIENDENETEPPGELSWKEKLMFLSLWMAAIIIPLQTLYRIN
jgi:stage IV sporulation protein FB